VITDETRQSRFSHVELAWLACAGGADVVQFRDKRDQAPAQRIRTARAIRERIEGRGARLIVNDHPEVAAASKADGVHLGPGDPAPSDARRLLGPDRLIGATANDLAAARAAASQPVDYLGVGPVFGTASKHDPAPTLGLAGLRRIVEQVDRPVIAIGNIRPEQVGQVLAAGAHGVAVLSAVVCNPDPAARAAEFVEAIERALLEHAGR
jgi:thiamine-phosphate pyrophosphorylase